MCKVLQVNIYLAIVKMWTKTKPTEWKIKEKFVHWNWKRSKELWAELMELIKMDVFVESACAYCGITKQTFYDWIRKDQKLADEYAYAKDFLDIASSNLIWKAIVIDQSKEDAWKWKTRRDKRYAEKQSVKHSWSVNNPMEWFKIKIEWDDKSDKGLQKNKPKAKKRH